MQTLTLCCIPFRFYFILWWGINMAGKWVNHSEMWSTHWILFMVSLLRYVAFCLFQWMKLQVSNALVRKTCAHTHTPGTELLNVQFVKFYSKSSAASSLMAFSLWKCWFFSKHFLMWTHEILSLCRYNKKLQSFNQLKSWCQGIGWLAFVVVASELWNKLPPEICAIIGPALFKSKLKTFFVQFKMSFKSWTLCTFIWF